ncbi:TetR/AcrR family transcriptional regulator [Nannocystis punicea]|uniref:TetR/AcrR family transcriptional regulator n=1 Tax=Nannocystis punicea TaxID=2995304 RepID=A0ABY7GXP2_9BACT|nr:TetR/AcrR family transcriptional regulator [Nannocystis poenicansa]WAS91753.1 TetR/AcrR family transcriptional regulator [Nannocystis poenicansa]
MPPRAGSSDAPRSFVEEARRAQIVQCTIEIIASLGYAQASLASIAERAGISKGVISYHFAGKDELIAQVYTSVMTKVAGKVLATVEAQPRAAGKLRAYIEGSIAFIADHGQEAVALLEIWNGLRTHTGQQVLDARTYEPGLEFLQAIFRQGQADGEFRRFTPRAMAVAVRSVIDGVLIQRATYGAAVDLAEASREAVALFEAATRATPDDTVRSKGPARRKRR